MPRAAMSVATRIWYCPVAEAVQRRLALVLGQVALQGRPSGNRPCTVCRQALRAVLGAREDEHRLAGGLAEQLQQQRGFERLRHRVRACAAPSRPGPFARPATVTGSRRISSARRRISGGMVAENSSVWRRAGRWRRMSRMSGRNPMSNIWSASSSTSTSTGPIDRVAAANVVEQAAGAGDDDIGACRAALDLGLHADAAVDAWRCAPACARQPAHIRMNLLDELAGGGNDQGAHPAGGVLDQALQDAAARRRPSCRCRSGPGP